MDIRVLLPSDAPALWLLRLEALEQEPRAFSQAAEEHRTSTVEETSERLADTSTGSFVLGLFAEGETGEPELQGMIGLHREARVKLWHKATIWGVYVSPKLRGRGAGRALMQACLDRAATLDGLRQIKLGFADANAVARALYQSFGFEVYGEEKESLMVDGESITEIHMVKRLV